MDTNVQELVSSIKKVLVYYKLFEKNYPEFAGFDPEWNNIQEKVNADISTTEQIEELIELSATILVLRKAFIESNPQIPLTSSEVESAFSNLNSAISNLKGV